MHSKGSNNHETIDVKVCSQNMSFQECELTVVRHAVEESESIQKDKLNTMDIRKMISIVETFLKTKKLICYGGTAINNILPIEAQFYDKKTEIPDYDFFSSTPLEDCKELADIYFNTGFVDVEAKAGVHYGTFKVFVNYTPMADITYMHPSLFQRIYEESISISDIRYCPADFLRMNMYLELSRPAGDVSRWDKVVRRLILLNKYHPIKSNAVCIIEKVDENTVIMDTASSRKVKKMQLIIQEEMANLGAVFFGGYAASLYSKYMNSESSRIASNVICLDVIYENPNEAVQILREKLKNLDLGVIKVIKHEEFNDMIPQHVELQIDDKPVIFIFKPIACHNYNEIKLNNLTLNIATIDTMMTFYLAFYYTQTPSLSRDRIFCMVQFMFDISQKWLMDRGILKRFSTVCYGYQPTLTDIRAKKTAMRRDPKIVRGSHEFEMWFLNYKPFESETKLRLKKAKAIKQKNISPIKLRKSAKVYKDKHVKNKSYRKK